MFQFQNLSLSTIAFITRLLKHFIVSSNALKAPSRKKPYASDIFNRLAVAQQQMTANVKINKPINRI